MPGLRYLLVLAIGLAVTCPALPVAGAALKDAAGRPVGAVDATRVLSIGGSVTEILYALGLEDRIVAVDTTSVHPPEAMASKPNVGYMRALSAEGVLSLNPTLILALDGSGPPNVIDVLRKASVSFVAVPDVPTADGILEKIRLVAEVMSVPERGAALAESVAGELVRLEQAVAGLGARKRVLFVLSMVNGRPLVGGANTNAHGVLGLAGADNAVTEFEGYKPVSDEAIIAGAPDALLMMDHMSRIHPPDQVFAVSALAATPAGRSRTLISMEGQYLLGFGPRAARAARELALRLYPDHVIPELDSGSVTGQ